MAHRGQQIRLCEAGQQDRQSTPTQRLTMSNTSSFGLDRDFLERFNAPGYKPFKTLQEHQEASEIPGVKEEQRARWRENFHNHKKGIRVRATRVNKTSHICDPSGEQIQRAAIRSEYTKAKAASGAN